MQQVDLVSATVEQAANPKGAGAPFGQKSSARRKPAKNYLLFSLCILFLAALAHLATLVPLPSAFVQAICITSMALGVISLLPIWIVVIRPFEGALFTQRPWRGIFYKFFLYFDFMPPFPPASGYKKFLDFLSTLSDFPVDSAPRTTVTAIDEARRSVLSKTLIPGSSQFEAFIEEMRKADFPVGGRHYQMAKYRQFVASFGLVALSIIIDFSAINAAAHFYSPTENFNFYSGGRPVEFLLESLYFSVVTAATVGYGEVNPNHGALAQVLVMFEISTVFIFIVFGFSFGVSLLSVFDVDCNDLAETLRDELESYSGKGLTFGDQ